VKPSEFRETVLAEVWHPFTIRTKGGAVLPIAHQSGIWFPDGYERTVCVSIPGKGIMLIDIDSIEAVQFEHQVAAFN
jgi:hypothetical protein